MINKRKEVRPSYSKDNDDQNFEYKHYISNNGKHVVNDRLDTCNNTKMNMENFEQELFVVAELPGNNFHF
jgi:hypothetical protein